MTKRPAAKSILTWALAAAITAGAVWVTLAAWQLDRRRPRPLITVAPPQAGEQPDPFGRLLKGDGGHDLLMNTGAVPLEGNPADLPMPAGAQRLLGYRISANGVTEDVAVWSIAGGDVDAATKFLDDAAAAIGFRPVTILAAPDGPISRVYQHRGRTLTIRIARRDNAIRVVLHLRYTRATGVEDVP